jgi:cellulose synthase (UDP-forming)
LLALCNLAAGLVYLSWRYAASINTEALVLAILLVLAESYGYVDSLFYALTMWKPAWRTPPPPLAEASVDVFITTYNEPVEIVRMTAEAAVAIDWSPLAVHILDDGSREAMKALAESLGCGYITRGEEWEGRKRHAKAGNVNNALTMTSGDFILILDADQIPDPSIVRKTVGYFADPALAFVQTPQEFYNLPPGDPFGSDAPLFYGPIMRGKDGWNAAYFCGSNALLRREALMQVGLSNYADAAETAVGEALRDLWARSRLSPGDDGPARAEKRAIRRAVTAARRDLRAGKSTQTVTGDLKAALAGFGAGSASKGLTSTLDESFGMARKDEALAVEGVSTVSITEDMATALRLHGSGWKSLFHSETLAHGLAPEDLGSALTQRLRWAQGTMQVLLRDSPLSRKGLSPGQRLMYFATIFSYLSGFANLIFVLCPIIFLFFGLSPVRAWNVDFFLRFVPFYLLNRLMFYVAAEGVDVKRGEQYNLALFPLWIKAVVGVFTKREVGFSVTPKTRQTGNFLPLIKVQLGTLVITVAGMVYAALGLALGWRADYVGILVNAFWGCYNIWQLLILVRAARYRPPEDWKPHPPSARPTQGA